MPEDPPRIHVVHATAPGCSWSWGYEAAMNRLRMVYGDQIDLAIRVGSPYSDWQQWLKDYEMTEQEACDWVNNENGPLMGVALARLEPGKVVPNVYPASLAVFAARKQDGTKAERFTRALLRMYAVEGKDPAKPDTMSAAAKEAGLDVARFQKDFANTGALEQEYENQEGPPVHVGFFNVVVWDGGNRRVMLDYCFDPTLIEGAIDYLSGGTLEKRIPKPDGIPAYLREHGWAPLSEVGRVFDLDPAEATETLEKLEKAGKVERATMAGAPHWRAV